MKLTKQEILEKSKAKYREVEIPEWEGSVTIKSLNTESIVNLQSSKETLKTEADYFAILVALSVIDEDGSFVYSIEEAKEISPTVLTILVTEIIELNNLSPEAVETVKDELKKVQ